MKVLAAAVSVALTTALAGCHDSSTGAARKPTAHFGSYVALGDSYTAGTGLPKTVADAVACGQSTLSYPHLVAEAVGAGLADASCGGATTGNGAQPQPQGDGQEPWPPQLDAVTSDADLVTVGLGANDFGWFLTTMFSCTLAARQDPTGHPCEQQATAPAADLPAVPAKIGPDVAALLTAVRRKAPHATVLLVGYPQPVPAHGSCDALPLAAGDYPFVRAQWEALDDAMRKAAAAAGATFVDVMKASEGHDVCAGSDAWVNGSAGRPGVAAPYHPFARGQAAVAGLIEQALSH